MVVFGGGARRFLRTPINCKGGNRRIAVRPLWRNRAALRAGVVPLRTSHSQLQTYGLLKAMATSK